jgi:hypothetical protein
VEDLNWGDANGQPVALSHSPGVSDDNPNMSQRHELTLHADDEASIEVAPSQNRGSARKHLSSCASDKTEMFSPHDLMLIRTANDFISSHVNGAVLDQRQRGQKQSAPYHMLSPLLTTLLTPCKKTGGVTTNKKKARDDRECRASFSPISGDSSRHSAVIGGNGSDERCMGRDDLSTTCKWKQNSFEMSCDSGDEGDRDGATERGDCVNATDDGSEAASAIAKCVHLFRSTLLKEEEFLLLYVSVILQHST